MYGAVSEIKRMFYIYFDISIFMWEESFKLYIMKMDRSIYLYVNLWDFFSDAIFPLAMYNILYKVMIFQKEILLNF